MTDDADHVEDDELEEFTTSSGISIGELRRRASGESGTPEEQEEARAEVQRINESMRGLAARMAQTPVIKDQVARIQRQAAELLSSHTKSVITPGLQLDRPEVFKIDPTSTPAVRSASALHDLVELQKAQADFNDALLQSNRRSDEKMVKWTGAAVVIAGLTLIATITGIFVTLASAK